MVMMMCLGVVVVVMGQDLGRAVGVALTHACLAF
jgi:hypothetical protein